MDKEEEIIIEPVEQKQEIDVTGAIIQSTPIEPEVVFSPKDDSKNILIIIAVLIGIFALIFASARLYTGLTGASVINIDDLHKENLENNLNKDEGYMYNGFSFVKVDGLWWTEVQRYNTLVKIPLHFSPNEIEHLAIEGRTSLDFDQYTDIYITIDPDVANKYYSLGIAELSMNMAKGINRNPIGVCTKKHPDCGDREIITCEKSNGKPVVEFSFGEETSIKAEGVCIKITGNDIDIVEAVDRLLYKWYGIME